MKNKSPMGVYLINCNASGQIYIGSSNHMRRRWSRHKKELRKNIHTNHHLQHAWNLYGEAAFVLVVLETCELSAIREREQHYLDTMNPFKPHGFNNSRTAFAPSISDEGRTRISSLHKGKPLSAEHRAKISAATRGVSKIHSHPREHTPLSPESRAKIAASNRGKKRTPEQCARMSQSKIGKKMPPRTPEHAAKISAGNMGKKLRPETLEKMRIANVGKKHTPESKAKMSAIQKTIIHKPHSPETRAKIKAAHNTPETRAKMMEAIRKYTYFVTSPEGVEIEVESLAQFCVEHKLRVSKMYAVAAGQRTHHKGYKVRRVEK